jgi:hypothetical protein
VLDWVAERSPQPIIRAREDWFHGAVVVNGFVNETPRNDRDGVERSVMAQTARFVLTCT